MKSFIRCWIIAVLIAAQPAAVWASNCRAVSFRRNVVHHNVVQKVIVKEVVAAVVVPVVAKLVAVEIPIYNTQFVAPYTAPYTSSYVPPHAPAYAPPADPYFARYSNPIAPVGAAPCPDHTPTFRQIASLLQVLDARLAKIEGVPPAGPPVMPPADPNGTGQPPGTKLPDPFNPGGQPPVQQPPAQTADRLLALAATHCASCHDKSRAQASGKGFVLLDGGKFSALLTPDSLGKMIDRLSSDDPNYAMPPSGHTMPDKERLLMISLLVAGPPK